MQRSDGQFFVVAGYCFFCMIPSQYLFRFPILFCFERYHQTVWVFHRLPYYYVNNAFQLSIYMYALAYGCFVCMLSCNLLLSKRYLRSWRHFIPLTLDYCVKYSFTFCLHVFINLLVYHFLLFVFTYFLKADRCMRSCVLCSFIINVFTHNN